MADESRLDLPHDTEGICFTCGYMGAYLPGQGDVPAAGSMLIFEATWGLRERGELWRAGASAELSTMPQCARLVHDPIKELSDLLLQDMERTAATREVLRKNRGCEKWCQYTTHFSPKEHLQEARMLEIEKMRQEQTKMIADITQRGQESMIQISEATRQVSADHLELAKTVNRSSTWYQRAFLALALVALTLALAPLAYPNGFSGLTEHAPGGEETAGGVQPSSAATLTPAMP
jgi:hypothetical protein